MLRAIVWDNDGVLVDTEQPFYAANRDLFRSLGREPGARHFFDSHLADNRGAWHLLKRQPSEAAIEDAPRGLHAATVAGIRRIILRNALTRHPDFPGAWRVVDSMVRAEVEAPTVH